MTHNLKPFPATGRQDYRKTYEALVYDEAPDPTRAVDQLLKAIARDRRKVGLDLPDAEAARIRQRLLADAAAEKARLDAEDALLDFPDAEIVSIADARAGIWKPKPKTRPGPPDTGGPQVA